MRASSDVSARGAHELPELRVRMTKRRDGGAVLRAERRDGSVTWQRQDGPRALFFPFHDLTHFAVETTLAFRQGFYGLIAEGWDIDDTGGKGRRGPLPPEAILAEHVVGLFDREHVGGATSLSADDFNALIQQLVQAKRIQSARAFAHDELDATRQRIDELHRAWAQLEPDASLELRFDRAPPSASSPR